MKRTIVSVALMATLLFTFAASTAAQPVQRQLGGAVGLVAAVLNLAVNDTIDINDSTLQVGLVNVDDSLNNLRALNNVLNNSPILSNILNNNDVDVTVYDVVDIENVLNQNDIDILYNFLNANDIAITDVVAIGVLSGPFGNDLVVFQ